jgi:hypothetical protein
VRRVYGSGYKGFTELTSRKLLLQENVEGQGGAGIHSPDIDTLHDEWEPWVIETVAIGSGTWRFSDLCSALRNGVGV